MALRRLLFSLVILFVCNAHCAAVPEQTIRLICPSHRSGFVIGQVLSEGLRDTFRRASCLSRAPEVAAAARWRRCARGARGHTLLVASPILTIMPLARPSLKLDAIRDFTPITLTGTIPNLMAVHPSVPAQEHQGVRQGSSCESRQAPLTDHRSGLDQSPRHRAFKSSRKRS